MGFGKDNKGQLLYGGFNQAIGALAAKDVLQFSDGYQAALFEDFRIIKFDYYLNYEPQATGDVLIIGIADGALTAAEIEECIESRPGDVNDIPEIEQAERAVWIVDILGESSAGSGPTVCKGEKTIRWTFKNDGGWWWWVYNPDGTTAITDNSKLNGLIKYYGVWVN